MTMGLSNERAGERANARPGSKQRKDSSDVTRANYRIARGFATRRAKPSLKIC